MGGDDPLADGKAQPGALDMVGAHHSAIKGKSFAEALGDRVVEFYRASGGAPLLVTGVTANDATLRSLSLDGLASALADVPIEGYSRETSARETFAAKDFFRDLRVGSARHNVVDHPVTATPLRDRVRVPGFLRANWLTADRRDLGISPLSLTISPAGNFTGLHIDAYGMQGWMLLLQGVKRWRFVAPELARPRIDPATSDVGDAPPEAWNGVERWEGELRAGDLMFIPPGWAHLVWTPEASVGIGGSVLNEHLVGATMASWLAERSCGFSDELDVAAMVQHAVADGVESPAMRAALAEHARWSATHA